MHTVSKQIVTKVSAIAIVIADVNVGIVTINVSIIITVAVANDHNHHRYTVHPLVGNTTILCRTREAHHVPVVSCATGLQKPM